MLSIHVVVETEAISCVGGAVWVFWGDAEHGADQSGFVAFLPGAGGFDVHEEP